MLDKTDQYKINHSLNNIYAHHPDLFSVIFEVIQSNSVLIFSINEQLKRLILEYLRGILGTRFWDILITYLIYMRLLHTVQTRNVCSHSGIVNYVSFEACVFCSY